ncbi:hypothetical protein J1614_007530 [Plenodomus biglobosus]|nr:hypothetical protein J1614_007530 [Plenodomus biglobosus]
MSKGFFSDLLHSPITIASADFWPHVPWSFTLGWRKTSAAVRERPNFAAHANLQRDRVEDPGAELAALQSQFCVRYQRQTFINVSFRGHIRLAFRMVVSVVTESKADSGTYAASR